jgi:hypothetical protein
MRHNLAVLTALAALSASTFAVTFAQQTAPPPAAGQRQPAVTKPPATAGTGLILGRVVDAGTGKPIPGARVMVTGGADRAASLAAAGLMSVLDVEINMAAATGGPGTQRVITDADGRFVLRNLAKGAFPITTSMPGYLPGASGRYRHDGPTRPIELEEGERRTDVVIRMWKYAAISGVVVDEAGEPAVGVGVRALRRVPSGTGSRLQTGMTAYTDDRGHYRMGSLVPGDYLVAVPSVITTVPRSSVEEYMQAITAGDTSQLMQVRSASSAPVPSPSGMRVGDYQIQISPLRNLQFPPPDEDGRLSIYRTTFHPASYTSAEAQVVTVGSGEDRQNVNINLTLTPTVFIAGVVSGPDGPMRGLGLRLVPAEIGRFQSDNGFEAATASTDGLGRFTLLGVPPGQYLLKALHAPVPVGPAAGTRVASIVDGFVSFAPAGPLPPTSAPAGPMLWAEHPVSVGDRNVSDLHLALREGARVSGRVEFTGAAAPPPVERQRVISISLTPIEPATLLRPQPGRLAEAGQFTTGGFPPGRYLMTATTPGPPWSVRAITYNGRNVLDEPFDLESTDIAGVVVTYTDRQTQLTLNVHSAGGANLNSVQVLVFPAEYQKWIQDGMAARRTRTATVSRSGVATLTAMTPGEYFAIAVPEEAAFDIRNPASIEMLARQATRITVAEGEARTQALTVSTVR